MKSILFLFAFGFTFQAKAESLQSLLDHFCQLEQNYRQEYAPRTRSAQKVLPFRPPPQGGESPLQYLRSQLRSEKAQKTAGFLKTFWEKYEAKGGSRLEAQKEIARIENGRLEKLNSSCEVTMAEKAQLFSELKADSVTD